MVLRYGRTGGTMEPSIRDVARRAGVSAATVSRILNGTAAVSEKKVQAVREAVEYYSYEPNQFARGLKKQSSRMIGVYFPAVGGSVFDSSYNLELLKGIEKSLRNRDYSMVLISENDDYWQRKKKTPKYLEYLRQKKIDGLLLSGLPNQARDDQVFRQIVEEYPVVYIGKRVHKNGLNVYAQFEQYSVKMIRILYEQGHRKILFFISEMHRNHLEAIRRQAHEQMPELELCSVFSEGFEKTGTEARSVIETYVRGQGCTAVSARGIFEAQILLSACAQLQLKVPEQVSVISAEHSRNEGAVLYPQISAMYVPVQAMGAGAAELLLDYIEGKEPAEHYIEYETKYMERDSIRRI